MKRALITGITGQDGAYLARLLLEKGYEVYGAHRRASSMNAWRLDELGITNEIRLTPLELTEFTNILRTIESIEPDEIYNLAAQSFVALSFDQPIFTTEVDAVGVARLLEVIRTVNPRIRFYQASSSEMFGKSTAPYQSEETPFYPRSPYGISKLYAHWMTVNYRESYNIHASSGILFNHESPFRGAEFVTRKISIAMVRMSQGKQSVLELGDLEPRRDWGFAGDYVQGMWSMLQQEEADDYVLSTGHSYSVRDFVDRAAQILGYDLEWDGTGQHTKAVDRRTGNTIVKVRPDLYRPAEVYHLTGRSTKAQEKLGWRHTVGFDQLVEMMVRADLERLSQGRL